MKKIIYSMTLILAVTFVGCEPLDELYEDIDANAVPISGDIEYTLTEDDYTDDEDDGGLGLRFPNFSSEDQAKELIPGLLSDRFPALKDNSSALVTYDLFFPKRDERSLIVYEVTDQDYDDLGHRFSNFDSQSEMIELLELRFPNPEDRTLVSLTYDYFAVGQTDTFNDGYLYIEGEWQKMMGFTDDEYRALGFRFPNFSSEDEAVEKIPALLKEKLKFVDNAAGDIVGTMYKLFVTDVDDVDGDGRTDDRTTYSYVKYFIYDGAVWSEYNNVISQQLQFGHDGTTWIPDNTIKYTLTGDDIALISSEFASIYEGPADNVGFFGSFDRRSSSSNYWTDAMLLEAFNVVLDTRDPNAEEGQKYILTYVVFTGSTGNESKAVIKKGGVWVYQ
ncbi:hypothetical protein EYD45_09665 [Hyunsoonleella flava]|uniref:DUF5017 domain-containing protein n=1 Tax=Hyunsoonleella flava TaxID=2527939 RepID=A0A4V2JA18_9FLAO|nr:hypothetical protein [Hyunsoonleella flava]TBN03268.1 hypothetical protein EYD45_09665 [Hyunsoonleella flava]